MRVFDLQNQVESRLEPASDTARLDAQVLLAHTLGCSRTWLLAHPEEDVSVEHQQALEPLVTLAAGGYPLPYIVGGWEFYGHWFELTPATLIPRPETELLVEQAGKWLRRSGARWVLDIGTGSGCIGISLAFAFPAVHVLGVDRSLEALRVAGRNARRMEVIHQFSRVQADLLPPITQPIDLLCANLPYIPSRDLDQLRVARYEPRTALDGGVDGLALISRLLEIAGPALAPGGVILLEIGADQGKQALSLGRAAFPGARVDVLTDLAGKDRLLEVELPGEG